jgi:hypothetical protein
LTEIMPLLAPMLSITGTGSWFQSSSRAPPPQGTRSARCPSKKDQRLHIHATDDPRKSEQWAVLREGAGRDRGGVPTWSVTGWPTGSIAGAVLLKVKLDSRAKASWFALRSKAIWSLALKARRGRRE